MYRLRRIHLESVGHSSARFDPLDLDFRGDDGDEALDTVLWLNNTGGKSSILSLTFSVLIPDKRQFLGRDREGKVRQLSDYVLADDLSHIVLEWSSSRGLPGLGKERVLVIGSVLSRRREGLGDLDRDYYAFYAHPGSLTFDDLRFRDGRRRLSRREFLEEIQEANRRHPREHQAVITDKGSDWREFLTFRGLDAEVFRYQLSMNEREGGATSFLDFSDGDSFVDFLVRVVIKPDPVEEVARNLNTFAQQLRKRPQLERERDFGRGMVDLLERVDKTSSALKGARSSRAALAERARRLVSHLERSSQAAIASAAGHRARGDAAERARVEHNNLRSAVLRRANGADLVLAEFEVGAAESDFSAADQLVTEMAAEIKVWDAVPHVQQHQRLQAQFTALDRALGEQLAQARPQLDRYRDAAIQLRQRYLALAIQSRDAATDFHRREKEADRARVDLEASLTEVVERLAALRREEELLREAVETADRHLLAAHRDGLLLPTESPTAARDRLEKRLQETTGHRAETEVQRQRVASQVAAHQREVERLSGLLPGLEQQLTSSRTERDRLKRLLDGLNAEPRLAQIAGVEEVAVLQQAGMLQERLLAAIAQTTRETVEARVAAAEDERANLALEHAGLLPPSLDVERAHALLARHKIAASSGFEYLARNVASRYWDRVIAERPWLLLALVVTKDASADALSCLREAGFDASLLLLVAESEDFKWVEEPVSTAMTTQVSYLSRRALFDPNMAHEASEVVTSRLARVEERTAQLAQSREEDAQLLLRLRTFLDECSPSRLSELADSIRLGEEDLERKATELATAREQRLTDEQSIEGLREEDRRLEREQLVVVARAASVERLVELDAERGLHEARLSEVRRQITGAAEERQRQEDDLARAQESRTVAAERANAAELDASGWAQRAAGIEAAVDSDQPVDETRPLLELEAEYGAARKAYEEKTSGSDLARERALVAERLQQSEEVLLAEYADVLKRAQLLAADPATSGQATRRARKSQASDQHSRALTQRIQADQALIAARRHLGEARQVPPARMHRLKEEERPADLTQARVLFARLTDDARLLQQSIEADETARDEARRQLETQEQLASRFADQRRNLEIVVGTEPTASAEAFESMAIEDAKKHVEELTVEWRAVTDRLDGATRSFSEACTATKIFASKPEFSLLADAYLDRYRASSDELLGEIAAEDSDQMRARILWLEKSISDLEGDREKVVLELVAPVQQAKGVLRDAQALRLPGDLGGWSGQHYLRISNAENPSADEVKARLRVLVDDLVSRSNAVKGMSLLIEALHAAYARSPFDVSLLKPNGMLDLDRRAANEIKSWSGGEKLTSAILIYCALIRLRQLARGSSPEITDSVLFLDNPIAEANLTTLIQLQRQVANAMRVQLIFTTGLKDLPAVSAFRNVIRLRNRKDLAGSRKYVSVAQLADHALVDSARVFLREVEA